MKQSQLSPPKLAQRILLLFLRKELAEEVIGDLDENFVRIASGRSALKARINYWYQVFNYLRPFAFRKRKSTTSIPIDMFRNYLLAGWRNMAKHRLYSTINIGGFAIGIAACIVLSLYIVGELGYDKHYVNKDRIYRVVNTSSWEGQSYTGLYFAHPFGDALQESFPEIEKVGYYNPVVNFGAGESEIRRTDRIENTHEDGMVFMTQGLLDILEVPFVEGNPGKALTEPNSIVITKSRAEKFFRGESAIGKSFILNNDESKTYTITGVVEDFPSNSHLDFNFMLTLEGKVFFEGERNSWCCNNYINYILLREGTDPIATANKFRKIVETHMLPDARLRKAETSELEWMKSFTFALQPVDDIYLNQSQLDDDLSHGDIRFIWLFGSITLFILCLACINFINLSTARSANRAKEVGVRKAIGSRRSALVRQFITESCLYSFIAMIFGLVIALAIIPFFNRIVGTEISLPFEWWLLPSLTMAALFIGVLAGTYPAFYLSAFRPAKVLKGGYATGRNNGMLRSVLVVFQFTISIVLIVGTVVVSKQTNYALRKELGFDRDGVMILNGTTTLKEQIVPFKNELLNLSEVKSVTVSAYVPVQSGKRDGGGTRIEGAAQGDDVSGQQWLVDHDYVRTMGFKIAKGRDFDEKITSDSQGMIINEKMAKSLGLKDPVGTRVVNYAGTFTIIGVVEDFHYESVKQPIRPLTMFVRETNSLVSVKLSGGDIENSVASITAVWNKFSPDQPIRFEFLDDQYRMTYNDVQQFGMIIKIFATLAIVVACLGLFALSAFITEQRGKETSIRIIFGASIASILRLLTQNFMILVCISILIAFPIAWVLMNRWLQDYAYRTDITWDIFAVTAVLSIVIALATIGYQSLKASVANPINYLKE